MTAVVLDGIVLGLAFGLLGVGMTLVYGLGGVINLAYGQIVVLAAIVASIVMEDGRATVLAATVGVAAAAGVAVLLDLTLMRPVYRARGEERTLLGLLLTLGAAFVIGGLLTWRYPDGALYIFVTGEPVSILGVPMAIGSIWASVIALAAAALLLVFFGATTFGRGVRSVIQDETGARLVGINPSFVRTVIFALSGALAGLAGVVLAARLGAGQPVAGTGWELDAIAAVVVGGTSLSGGEGKILGTLIGAFIIAVIQNGMNLTGVKTFPQRVVLGLVILGAVLLDRFKQQAWRLRLTKKRRAS
jgi:ribose/xylose/arabinose/galactoside ABC-type transport system permease subunit